MSERWKELRRVFRLQHGRREVEGDVTEELRFHLEERIEELVAGGLTREAAEREARSRFGDLGQLRAQLQRIDHRAARRATRGEAGKAFLRDLRLGLRGLRRHPGFTLAAVLTLGLGMGATGAIYNLLWRVVLAPLPYPAADRLVRLKNPVPGVEKGGEWNLSTAQYFYYRQHVPELERFGLYRSEAVNATAAEPGGGEARRAHAVVVTASMMSLLGARAIAGRLLTEADDATGAPAVAVLSAGLWHAEFGADRAVIGKTIRLNGEPVPIIGVMAPGVELPRDRGEAQAPRADLWLPIRLNPAGPFYNNHVYPVIARLAPGATLPGAEQRIARLRGELPQAFPNAYSAQFFERYRFHTVLYPLKQYALGDLARNLWMLFGAVGLVLLIACANVASLLFARLETRRHEFALRSAIGATRGHLAREAFAEGILLALAGAAVATLVSAAGIRWLVALSPAGLPRLETGGVDGRVLLFMLGVALAIAVALTLVPVLQYRSLGTGASGLGEAGRGPVAGSSARRQRLRSGLVVAQVALALMLVVGAGLLLQSFRRLRAIDPGIDAQGVLTLDWYLPYQRYDSLSKVWRFHSEVLGKLRALPGVSAAGASEELPFLTGFGCTVQGFEEPVVYDRIKQAGLTTCAGQAPTTPGYFEALRIPLLAGRYFSEADNTAPERGAVIVTKAFAERFWPGENPLGKGVNPNGRGKPPFYHVVGMVGDLHGTALDEPPGIGIFYPIVAMPGGGGLDAREMHLVVRVARGDPLALLPAVRSAVNAVDPTIPIANAEPMSLVVSRSMGRLTFSMLLLGIAGAMALALAAVGLYGLIAFMVARRSNEIGVRIALGARGSQVETLVVGGALKLAGLGLLIGLLGAAASTRVLRGLLYGVTPWDLRSYFGAVLLLLAVACLAGWIPARRAARVDPVEVLRA